MSQPRRQDQSEDPSRLEPVDAPVALLSTSPERDDTILMRDPFRD